MKKFCFTLSLSSLLLVACGGSGGDNSSDIPQSDPIAKLANTSWVKECSAYNKLSNGNSTDAWNVITKLSIDADLKSTYKTEFYRPSDTSCDEMMFDTLDVSTFEFKGKAISDESIDAQALNETFVYNSDNGVTSPIYTLVYVHSEKLYFGQSSGSNNGESSDKRHSSISLDHYFIQLLN